MVLTELGIPKVNRRPAPVFIKPAFRPTEPKTVRCSGSPSHQEDRAGKEGIPMKSLTLKVQRFLVSEDGPTAVEYAVMLALIIIVCLTAISAVGTKTSTTFSNVASSLGALVRRSRRAGGKPAGIVTR